MKYVLSGRIVRRLKSATQARPLRSIRMFASRQTERKPTLGRTMPGSATHPLEVTMGHSLAM